MAEYLTNTTDLTKVASAIREKGGTSDPLVYPDGFVTAIQAIQTGTELQIIVTVTSGATVTATKGSLSESGTSVNGTCTLIVPEAGTWSVSATLDGKTSDTKAVTITDSYAVSLNFVYPTLNKNTWETIKDISDAGQGANYWSVGISTHAPAGGATAIFHKSVMRFCGKLPKDDTVLCLASFGFPRRDPKAVYLAWISCANLPQKCVRQGLALKDQGTSCFHEGLASHAFDPVLV